MNKKQTKKKPAAKVDPDKFDLQKALAGHPVRTRDGRKVSKVVYFEELEEDGQPVVTVLDNVIGTFSCNGSFLYSAESALDLFMDNRPQMVKLQRWVGAVKTAAPSLDGWIFGWTYPSEVEAMRNFPQADFFIPITIEFEVPRKP